MQSKLKDAETSKCQDVEGEYLLTIADYRTKAAQGDKSTLSIKSSCPTVTFFFDDLMKPDVRSKLQTKSPVILVSETGNRDKTLMQFMKKHNSTNIFSLKFGMRGWLKAGYPTHLAAN